MKNNYVFQNKKINKKNSNVFIFLIFFKKIFIYLFIWLHRVLVAACGI